MYSISQLSLILDYLYLFEIIATRTGAYISLQNLFNDIRCFHLQILHLNSITMKFNDK